MVRSELEIGNTLVVLFLFTKKACYGIVLADTTNGGDVKNERTISISSLQKLAGATTEVKRVSLKDFLKSSGRESDQSDEINFLWLKVSIKTSHADAHRGDAEKIVLSCPALNYLKGDFFCLDLREMLIDDGGQKSFEEKYSPTILSLRFFALGKFLGFWSLITPSTLGFLGEYAYRMALEGLIKVNRRVDQRGMGGRTPLIVKAP